VSVCHYAQQLFLTSRHVLCAARISPSDVSSTKTLLDCVEHCRSRCDILYQTGLVMFMTFANCDRGCACNMRAGLLVRGWLDGMEALTCS
jgi:hypothetical protein